MEMPTQTPEKKREEETILNQTSLENSMPEKKQLTAAEKKEMEAKAMVKFREEASTLLKRKISEIADLAKKDLATYMIEKQKKIIQKEFEGLLEGLENDYRKGEGGIEITSDILFNETIKIKDIEFTQALDNLEKAQDQELLSKKISIDPDIIRYKEESERTTIGSTSQNEKRFDRDMRH